MGEYTRRGLMRSSAVIGLSLIVSNPSAAEDGNAALGGNGMPYAAFDRIPADTIKLDGARLRVAFGPGAFDTPRQRILDYIRQSAMTVAGYFGRFPAQETRLLVLNTGDAGRPIRSGTAFGYRGAAIRLVLSAQVTPADMDRDWILVHEMSHLALPSLPRPQHWFEEGMATYVEPLARAQAGLLSAERVWLDLVTGMPQGLPAPGDRGLDHTPTWGRTYWGGALFCLLADIELRQATAGRGGLQHALRAILQQGNIEQDSPIEPLLQAGDRATGTGVLMDLYARMKDSPYPVDLEQTWAMLGVRVTGSVVDFNDAAPLAGIRKALTVVPAEFRPR